MKLTLQKKILSIRLHISVYTESQKAVIHAYLQASLRRRDLMALVESGPKDILPGFAFVGTDPDDLAVKMIDEEVGTYAITCYQEKEGSFQTVLLLKEEREVKKLKIEFNLRMGSVSTKIFFQIYIQCELTGSQPLDPKNFEIYKVRGKSFSEYLKKPFLDEKLRPVSSDEIVKYLEGDELFGIETLNPLNIIKLYAHWTNKSLERLNSVVEGIDGYSNRKMLDFFYLYIGVLAETSKEISTKNILEYVRKNLENEIEREELFEKIKEKELKALLKAQKRGQEVTKKAVSDITDKANRNAARKISKALIETGEIDKLILKIKTHLREVGFYLLTASFTEHSYQIEIRKDNRTESIQLWIYDNDTTKFTMSELEFEIATTKENNEDYTIWIEALNKLIVGRYLDHLEEESGVEFRLEQIVTMGFKIEPITSEAKMRAGYCTVHNQKTAIQSILKEISKEHPDVEMVRHICEKKIDEELARTLQNRLKDTPLESLANLLMYST